MAQLRASDKSNGYEQAAASFVSERDSRTGVATVREWSRSLPPGSSILDLGCGHGVPISEALLADGFAVYGIDASPTLIAAFRERFPDAHAQCEPVEESAFFGRTFDGVVASGLMFLLPSEIQAVVIGKVARALNPGGRFLFTAPERAATWPDLLTSRMSISLGSDVYRQILLMEGLGVVKECSDEGDNHYYFTVKE
jgi:SAM-dependent methyltransferase